MTTVIIYAFGERYSSFAISAVSSSLRLIEVSRVHLICNGLSTQTMLLLQDNPRVRIFDTAPTEFVEYVQQVSSSKLVLTRHFLAEIEDNQDTIWLDADAIILRNPTAKFTSGFELGLTFRSEGFPLNLGVIFVRKTERTRNFFEVFAERLERSLNIKGARLKLMLANFGAIDQAVLMGMLQDLYGTRSLSGTTYLANGQLVASSTENAEMPIIEALNCDEYNFVGSLSHQSELPFILHFKASMRKVIENFGVQNSVRFGEETVHTFEIHEAQLLENLRFAFEAGVKNQLRRQNASWNGVAAHKGIWPSEGVFLNACLSLFGIEHVIESGRAGGESTYRIAEAFPNLTIDSIDFDHSSDIAKEGIERLKEFKNITLIEGDAFSKIPHLLRKNRWKKVAVFIDGPKGAEAVRLSKKIMESKFPPLIIILHDTNKEVNGRPNVTRYLVAKEFDLVVFSDQINFDLGDNVDDATSARNHWMVLGKGSPSPTLAFLLPSWRYLNRSKVEAWLSSGQLKPLLKITPDWAKNILKKLLGLR